MCLHKAVGLLDITSLIMNSIEGETLSSIWNLSSGHTRTTCPSFCTACLTNLSIRIFWLFTSGTFVLYFLLYRDVKVRTIRKHDLNRTFPAGP
jgi:hypothetical protein